MLTDPVIHLEIGKDGHPNWDFTSDNAAKPEGQSTEQAAAKQSDSLRELRLGDVKLINGTIDYFDARTNERYAADQIGVTVSLPGLDERSTFDGSVTWRGKAIKLSIAPSGHALSWGPGTARSKSISAPTSSICHSMGRSPAARRPSSKGRCRSRRIRSAILRWWQGPHRLSAAMDSPPSRSAASWSALDPMSASTISRWCWMR